MKRTGILSTDHNLVLFWIRLSLADLSITRVLMIFKYVSGQTGDQLQTY